MAAQGATEPEEEDTSTAIAAILALGALALFTFPAIGHALHMRQQSYGIWAGLAVDNTAEATVTGALYGDNAGRFAILAKTALSAFIGFVVLGYAVYWASRGQATRVKNKPLFANAAYNSAYKSATAEGISVFVSSGDEGAASSDADLTKATHGIAVSGFASTPYNVAVGGTDFGDTSAGSNSSYWNSTNTSTYASANSYIPEIPWNDSCASTLLAKAYSYSTTYGSSGFCNSATGKADYLTTASGSGGPSGCATGKASTAGVVGGTCKGYAKPSWQSLVGNPADGVRDLPDVSLFAANGVWGHYYVFCWTDTREGGASCSGAPSTWSGAGGTSFASPIMAAIQSLVNQKTASSWGNPNPTYYNLAAAEYGTAGNSSCNSSNGNAAASNCTFYDVTAGDMDVNCTGKVNCYIPSGTNGVLSTSTTSYAPAYKTGTGWDFATGIGSVNAYNLVYNWTTVSH